MIVSESTDIQKYNAQDYEQRYRRGYGLLYPESHIIRVHRQILEWELNLTAGHVLDFGCGIGANLRYFAELGYIPYGCDTSTTAIEQCRKAMPIFSDNFYVTDVAPKLTEIFAASSLDVFMTNQVLYFLSDEHISDIVQQAFQLVKPGGVFVATMMAYSCWYMRYVTGREGDFRRVELKTPRQNLTTLINFKDKTDLENLFLPFRKLHVGSFGSWIREEEGSTDHWVYVAIRD